MARKASRGPVADPALLSPVGRQIMSLVAERGYPSLRAACMATGLDYGSVHRIMIGKQDPKLSMLERIAEQLGPGEVSGVREEEMIRIIIKSGTLPDGTWFYAAQLRNPAGDSSEDDFHGDACLTIEAAIGSLVRAHPERFGVIIRHAGTDK